MKGMEREGNLEREREKVLKIKIATVNYDKTTHVPQ